MSAASSTALLHHAQTQNHRFCVAPMMEWTDRHFRYFARLLSRRTRLYTEMVTTGALLHGDSQRFLRYDTSEHPLALQLGGSDPAALALCARMAEDHGYDEVNLNVGCPSDRVQNNMIGACLMAHPELVAECIDRMQNAVRIPITVKHRIGIDGRDSEAELHHFVETVAATGCRTFIVHARIAVLSGLSPKENRDIPPLKYEVVERLKARCPELTVIINGGITSLPQSQELLSTLDGVMVGREAYHNPWLLSAVDEQLFGEQQQTLTRHQAVELFCMYIEKELALGTPMQAMTRHILGAFHGVPGGRRFRRHLSENAHKSGVGVALVHDALRQVILA